MGKAVAKMKHLKRQVQINNAISLAEEFARFKLNS